MQGIPGYTLKDSEGHFVCFYRRGQGAPPPQGGYRLKSAGKLIRLIQAAEGHAGRQIIDATGLSGNFEWQVDFNMAGSSPMFPDAPPIDVAFAAQLGLSLRPATANLEVFVIDSVEGPSAN
jgi:uncharacterized protein (TIGR03435 family)